MRSLWMRLMGAFVLVILLYGVVNSLLLSRATRTQFSRYTSQTGLAWAQQLAPSLVQYYAANGDWQGVEQLFQSGATFTNTGMMGNMMQNVPQSGGMMGGNMMSGDVWSMMGFRLVLADISGKVIYDTSNQFIGTKLENIDLAAGLPLTLNTARIGTLLALSISPTPDSASDEFLRTLNVTTWQASLAAALFALVVGSLLFRQVIAPVRAVTVAARRIAGGDLSRRVPESGQDETGQLARAFNQMADTLAHDQILRRNMTADIAHELRTPLSVIQGNLEAMLDGVLPASPEEIASLRDETALLARLVSDLRLLSLAEAGQLTLDLAPTDLLDLTRHTLATLRPQAEAEDITLATDIPDTLTPVNIDPDRISQALHNLLANALRYTPSGGTVTVRIAQENHFVRVDISDTGSGIAPEDLPFLFDRFYRAEKSRSRSSGGSGIGLAIVRQLVQAHGGEVSAESPIFQRPDGSGYGSRFTFTLPPG